MVLATLGIAVSALVGALCRDSTVALLTAMAAWAFVYGMSNSIGTATAWVGQQCCVFLVVSSAAPSTPGTTHDLLYSALLRGAGVLAGGALQTCFLLLLRVWFPAAQTIFTSPDFDPTHFQRQFLREQLSPRSGAMQFALRMTVTAVLAIAHQPPNEVLLHRAMATVLGSGVALAVHMTFIAGRKALGIATPVLHSLESHFSS